MFSILGIGIAIYCLYQLKINKKLGKTLTSKVFDLKIEVSKLEEKKTKLANELPHLTKEKDDILVELKNLETKKETKELDYEKLNENFNKLNLKLKKERELFSIKEKELIHLIKLEKNENALLKNVERLTEEVETLKAEIMKDSNELKEIKNSISIYKETFDLQEVGYFEEPKYLFETSERFKEEIKTIRESQKLMIKENQAVYIPKEIVLINDSRHAQKLLKNQVSLMLKAFNTECDSLMEMIKPSNYAKILEKIEKTANNIEKLSVSLECGFKIEYIELKFKECELQYQFKLKDQREKEEQTLIKEQIREEQQAVREFERAMNKAEKEEQMYEEALEAAKKELEASSDEERSKLEKRISMLEIRLKEAEENKERAKSMAEQTKRGHVYVISNIGSFGENIYKIGLTRRLEPLDRIKELSNASVPFSFDVHAMIYSDNAPKLEKDLHNIFTNNRVNKINSRKEFFEVDLVQIRDKALEMIDSEVDFKLTALAEDYYESLKFKRA